MGLLLGPILANTSCVAWPAIRVSNWREAADGQKPAEDFRPVSVKTFSCSTGMTHKCTFYAVQGLRHCLLGCQGFIALGLIKTLFAEEIFVDDTSNYPGLVSTEKPNGLSDVPGSLSPPLPSKPEALIPKDIRQEFQALFTGFGCLDEPYTIQFGEDTKPHYQYASRSIALPLRPKVQAELQRMEDL